MVLSCVVVMGFPCKFRSIRRVFVQSSFGRGCGFPVIIDRWFLLSERTLRCFSLPMAWGRPTTTLSSRFRSARLVRFAMVSGTVAKWFDERSSFSSIFKGVLLSRMLRGMLESALFEINIVLRPLGSIAGRASVAVGLVRGLLVVPVATEGRPSRLWLAERVFSFGSDDRTAMVPGEILLWSTLSDLRTLRLESFGSRLLSLFLDKSSVVSLEILFSNEIRMSNVLARVVAQNKTKMDVEKGRRYIRSRLFRVS